MYSETISQLLDIMFNNRKIVRSLQAEKETLMQQILELKLLKNKLETETELVAEETADNSEEGHPSVQ